MIEDRFGIEARRAARARRLLNLLGPFLGLLLVVGLFGALAPDSFLTAYNFKNVATQTVIVGLGAIGMTFVIISGGIDLSIGSVIALSSVVTALFLKHDHPPALAVAAGVLTGGACGLVNGLLITLLRIVPFIVTLGMLGAARGFAKYLATEQKIDADPSWLSDLMTKSPEPKWLLVAPGVWILFLLAVVMAFVLRKSVLGVHTFAIGSNEDAARLCGVPVARDKVAIYTMCGLFAGLAGGHAVRPAHRRRPDHRDRQGARRHRRRRHRRRQPRRGGGEHPRGPRRRVPDVVPRQRVQPDRGAELRPGDHHRGDHRRRRGGRPAAPPVRIVIRLTYIHEYRYKIMLYIFFRYSRKT